MSDNNELDLRNLSQLSFVDYYRLIRENEQKGQNNYQVIFQHDNDELTYKEAKQALDLIVNDMVNIVEIRSNYIIDLIGMLVGMLVDKGVFTKEDANYFTESCIKRWELIKKEMVDDQDESN